MTATGGATESSAEHVGGAAPGGEGRGGEAALAERLSRLEGAVESVLAAQKPLNDAVARLLAVQPAPQPAPQPAADSARPP